MVIYLCIVGYSSSRCVLSALFACLTDYLLRNKISHHMAVNKYVLLLFSKVDSNPLVQDNAYCDLNIISIFR